jgi:hypothetical protein
MLPEPDAPPLLANPPVPEAAPLPVEPLPDPAALPVPEPPPAPVPADPPVPEAAPLPIEPLPEPPALPVPKPALPVVPLPACDPPPAVRRRGWLVVRSRQWVVAETEPEPEDALVPDPVPVPDCADAVSTAPAAKAVASRTVLRFTRVLLGAPPVRAHHMSRGRAISIPLFEFLFGTYSSTNIR